jgi:hypothetical protein
MPAEGASVDAIVTFVLFAGPIGTLLLILLVPGAFVPRASSELTVDRAARRLRRRRKPIVVDLCTGAGPIALAIGYDFPRAEVWGLDILDLGLAHEYFSASAPHFALDPQLVTPGGVPSRPDRVAGRPWNRVGR